MTLKIELGNCTDTLNKLSPEELCKAYRAELRRLYGDERAERSRVDYGKGWYYINVAMKFHDGFIGTIGPAEAIRRKQVIQIIINLRMREPK